MPPIERLDGSERVTVPGLLMGGSGDHYVLRVVGDNMIEECVMDGDFVIVRQTSSAADGEMAVCLIGDDATLKRVYHEGDRVRLESGRPGVLTLHIPADEVKIQGVVSGLMRKY